MQAMVLTRRAWIVSAASAGFAGDAAAAAPRGGIPLTLVSLGDSVLDCGHYNDAGVNPPRLLVHNDDRLFPDFRGRDLSSRGLAQLEHRATDGATVDDLPRQARGLATTGRHVAILTVGGNDLLRGLAADRGAGLRAFEVALDAFLRGLPQRPVLMGNVYDPTFGDDARNFLGVEARIARANHRRVNEVIGSWTCTRTSCAAMPRGSRTPSSRA